MQVPWGLAVAEIPMAAFLIIWDGRKGDKGTAVGSDPTDYFSTLSHHVSAMGLGDLEGGLAQLSLAQSPSCSGLLEIDDPGRESKKISS